MRMRQEKRASCPLGQSAIEGETEIPFLIDRLSWKSAAFFVFVLFILPILVQKSGKLTRMNEMHRIKNKLDWSCRGWLCHCLLASSAGQTGSITLLDKQAAARKQKFHLTM